MRDDQIAFPHSAHLLLVATYFSQTMGLLDTSWNINIQKCGYILSIHTVFFHFVNLLINSVSIECTHL